MSEANFKIMYHILGEQTIPAFLAAIQYPADIKHYILTTKSVKTQLAAKNLQAAFNRRGYANELFYIGEEAAAVSSFHLIPEIEKIMSNTNPDNLPACAEVTGGTKLMFYAMIVAARERKMTIIYVDTANRQLQYLNNGSVATLEQSLTLDDFMTLSGCKFCKPGSLSKGLTAGEGDASAEGIGFDDLNDLFFLHLGAAAEGPGFRIVAAGTMMRAALAEDGGANTGAIHDGVTDDSG